MQRTTVLILVWSFIGLIPSLGRTEPHKVAPRSQLAVDLISLKAGQTLRGVFVQADAKTVIMAVSRDWLKEALPHLYQKATADEDNVQKQVSSQLQTRLKLELSGVQNESRVKFFLKSEQDRIESSSSGSGPASPSQFVGVSLSTHSISKITRAPPDRLRIAGWAWSETLSNVESRDFQDLERELKQRNVDPTAPPPDLTSKVSPRPQDEREWAARMAILDYTLSKPINFEGTADVLIRSNGERKGIDFAPIVSKLMRSQVDTFLKELTSEVGSPSPANVPGNWLKAASREADQESARGLRATQVIVKSEGNEAVVQMAFAARMPDKSWEVIWAHQESKDATVPRANLEAKIFADPQVKQVLNTLAATGLSAEDQIQKAIRFGAATMDAQQAADTLFMQFCDRYSKRLDTPPLTWVK